MSDMPRQSPNPFQLSSWVAWGYSKWWSFRFSLPVLTHLFSENSFAFIFLMIVTWENIVGPTPDPKASWVLGALMRKENAHSVPGLLRATFICFLARKSSSWTTLLLLALFPPLITFETEVKSYWAIPAFHLQLITLVIIFEYSLSCNCRYWDGRILNEWIN